MFHSNTGPQGFPFQTALETNSAQWSSCEQQGKHHPEDSVDRSNVSNWSFHPDTHEEIHMSKLQIF